MIEYISDTLVACSGVASGTDVHTGTHTGIAGRDNPEVEERPSTTNIVMGLESSQCFVFKRSTEQAKRLRNHNVLIFDLEEDLPFDGEDLAVGRVHHQQGALFIAADGQAIASSVQRCIDDGKYVSAISPLILLAMETLKKERSLRSYDLVVWKSGKTLDVIRLWGGKPMDWRWSNAEEPSLLAALDALCESDENVTILAINLPKSLVTCFAERMRVESWERDREQAAVAASQRIAKGHARPMVDLRSGPLESAAPLHPISKPLRIFVAAAFVAQLAIAGAAFLRGHQFRESASQVARTQEVVFERLFDGEPIPVGVVSRLESERRRLAGTRGIVGQGIPPLGSVIPVSHKFLSAMPDTSVAKYTLDRVELMPGRIQSVTGTAKSYGALEKIAEQLRLAGFDVPPVSATKTALGVTLRFDEISMKGKSEQEKQAQTGDLH